MFKRVFSKARSPETVTKSIRMPSEMSDVIERLADDAGETLNGYIVLALDLYLQELEKRGELPAPQAKRKKA
jgi:hypothetical protein